MSETGTILAAGTRQKGSAGEALSSALRWLKKGQPVVLATVAETWGSAPVPAGGRMAVTIGDDFAGAVSGGCVEADVISTAAELIEDGRPRLLSYGVEDETAWRVGLPCGGRIKVIAELFQPGRDQTTLERMAEVASTRRAVLVQTSMQSGERTFHDIDSGPAARLLEQLGTKACALIANDADNVFVAAVRPNIHVIIVGASRIAQVLVDLVRPLGLNVTVVDPRTAFASQERFPSVNLAADWPDAAFSSLKLDPETAVVALSHVKDIDDQALQIALASRCFYVGALGSKRNAAARHERLTAAGLSGERLARIRSPVGLDIGAKTPEEIALSILAEIISTARGKASRG